MASNIHTSQFTETSLRGKPGQRERFTAFGSQSFTVFLLQKLPGTAGQDERPAAGEFEAGGQGPRSETSLATAQ